MRHTGSTIVDAGTRPSRSGKLADAHQGAAVDARRVGLGGAGQLGRVRGGRKRRGGIGMDAGRQRCAVWQELTSCGWRRAASAGRWKTLRGLADAAAAWTCAATATSAMATAGKLTGSVNTRRPSASWPAPRPSPTAPYLLPSVRGPRSSAAGAGALRPRGDELMDATALELGGPCWSPGGGAFAGCGWVWGICAAGWRALSG